MSFAHGVLSKAFEDRIGGRRVLTALFLTFEFEPEFFELEVLPVLFDQAYGHEANLRLVQLEDSLRALEAPVAIYYDRNGLRADQGGCRLETHRIPMHLTTGIFHAKNVFVLVENPADPERDRPATRSLLVATMSANLTRTGWWSNVECCHIEELAADARTWFKEPLTALLRRLRQRAQAQTEHPALDAVLQFLRGTKARERRTAGKPLVAFWDGGGELVDFLRERIQEDLSGWHLEVLSPFFDDDDRCQPLADLLSAFAPQDVRILMPVRDGAATCSERITKAIDALPGVEWGELSTDFLRLGSASDAGQRGVHAKVYRFFRARPKRELIFVGSPNLTRAAFQTGGNWETGILIETEELAQSPEFWLRPLVRRPVRHLVENEEGDAAQNQGSPLQLRYHWERQAASAYWDAASGAPPLCIQAAGVRVGEIPSLPSRDWQELPAAFAQSLAQQLVSTSLLQAVVEGEDPQFVLVQEDGMAQRPALLRQLSVADILRCWSLLTEEQRLAFLADRGYLLSAADAAQPRPPALAATRGMFDQFAGIFHAFRGLERSVREALADPKRPRPEASYRLFGCKHDSLGHLLDRVAADPKQDDLQRYLVWLCAQQSVDVLRGEFPEFFRQHRLPALELDRQLREVDVYRQQLVVRNDPAMGEFLRWFEGHFMRRARPQGEES